MNPALAGVVLAITVGAIIAISVHDARTAVLGLAVAIVGTPIVADPIADTAGLAGRVVAAILAVYLLLIAVRDTDAPTGGSRIGWAAESSIAAAAGIVGFGTHGLGAAGLGPALAQAAGFALASLAVVPLVSGRDVIRIGLGLLLLVHGALLVRVGLGGTPSALEELVSAGLVVGLSGVIGVLAYAARRDGSGGFGLVVTPRGREPERNGRRLERRRPVNPETVPLWSPDSFPTDRS